MKDHRRDRKNKTELFNDRAKQRKEKQAEKAQRLEDAGKPGPATPAPTTNDNAPQPPAPAKPEPVVAAPKPPVKEPANRPGKAERERRGPYRSGGRKF